MPALWLLISTGGAALASGADLLPEHLAALRLKGPVLIEGQTGVDPRIEDARPRHPRG